MSRELIWPPSLRISSIDRQIIGNAGASRSPLSGASTTVDRSGDRWAVSVTIENLSDKASYAERANAKAFLAAIRNKNARVWIPEPGYEPRGSFSAPELFTNADFSNGTAGWTGSNAATSGVVLSVRDRVMRSTRTGSGANSFSLQASSATTVTAYTPYGARFFTKQGRGTYPTGWSIYNNTASGRASSITTQYGMLTGVVTPLSTSADPRLLDESSSGTLAGDYVEIPYASFARCALVDNGGNYMVQSDAAQTTWSATNLTVSANAHTDPNGTSTADGLTEDSSTGFHYLQQSYTRTSVAEDWCAYAEVATIASSRNVALDLADGAGNGASCVFDLTAGTAGTPSVTGTATNARAFIVNVGNGYRRCYLVARLPASTTARMQVLLANGSTLSYAGNGSGRISVWRMGAHRSSFPSRPTATTAAVVGPAGQTGNGLYLKGLPVSTSGLLLAGDAVQIGRQLFEVLAPLDSDAAGLGYLAVSPNIRTPFPDNEPVIINRPMGRYMLTDDSAGYSTRAGKLSTMTLSFEEALD